MIKEQILEKILVILNQRIDTARLAIESAKESRDNETKSSVGDKYETGRTLMQMEVEKNRVLLNKTERLKTELLKIDPKSNNDKVEFGSLILTGATNFFMSSAIGKIEVHGIEYICISLASPIGRQLQNKAIGDTIKFQANETTIVDIK